jgi:hypothetical protein
MGTGGSFPSGEWQGHEADHSPTSSAEVKNGRAIPPLPPVSSWHSAKRIKHSDNFTFYCLMKNTNCEAHQYAVSFIFLMLLFSFKTGISILHLLSKHHQYIRFEILMVVTVKSTIYWYVMPSALAKSVNFSQDNIVSINRVKE